MPSPAGGAPGIGVSAYPQRGRRWCRAPPLPVHSFHTLLADLATLTRNAVRLGADRVSTLLATPTAVQRRALALTGAALPA